MATMVNNRHSFFVTVSRFSFQEIVRNALIGSGSIGLRDLTVGITVVLDLVLAMCLSGYSYTFYWNLPQSVGAMAESQNISMRARQSTASSANLAEHWKAERQLQTMERLRHCATFLAMSWNLTLKNIEKHCPAKRSRRLGATCVFCAFLYQRALQALAKYIC
jgi:hypothetical protein